MALIDQTRPEAVTMSTSAYPPSGRGTTAVTLRAALAGRAAVLSVTSFIGIPLFTLWVVLVALSPLTLVAPLVIPATLLLRRFATANRNAAGRLLGERVGEPYRPDRPGLLGRITGILRDPASWRDAWWAISHAVVGAVLSLVSITLLLGSVFYLIYPFLYSVTPEQVFRRPFGDWFELHSVDQTFALMPLGLVCFALWWFVAPALARAEAAYTRSLLR